MNTRYHKTAAGQGEVRTKSLQLSRPVRNLLLSINGTQPAGFWLSQLQGVSPADLQMLLDTGLIEPLGGAPTPPSVAASAPQAAELEPIVHADFDPTIPSERALPQAEAQAAAAPATSGDAQWAELQADLVKARYSVLYEVLNDQGKAQLGLVRGYRFALEVEKCNGEAEIHAIAAKFVERLRDEYGMAAVRRFHKALRAKA
jgi:hypothetical protein